MAKTLSSILFISLGLYSISELEFIFMEIYLNIKNFFWRAYYKAKRIIKNILGIQSYALYDMDLKLKKYLVPIKRGVFIEAGANNGIAQTNTFLYEEKYKWTGLLVEGISSLAQQCKKNRKNSIVENYVLDLKDGETVTMKHVNLMSFVEGSLKTKEEADGHLEFGIKYNIPFYKEKVETRRLSTLLDKHNMQHIDFFSLDVEGYELEVLKGLDFTRHRPTYILIEARYEEIITAFMDNVGYDVIDKLSFHDILYKNRLAHT
jgi:FkbM family methyltransferase